MNKITISKKQYEMLKYYKSNSEHKEHGLARPVVINVMEPVNQHTIEISEANYFDVVIDDERYFNLTESEFRIKLGKCLYETLAPTGYLTPELLELGMNKNIRPWLNKCPSIQKFSRYSEEFFNDEYNELCERALVWDDIRDEFFTFDALNIDDGVIILEPQSDGYTGGYDLTIDVNFENTKSECPSSVKNLLKVSVVINRMYVELAPRKKASFLTLKEARRYMEDYQKHNNNNWFIDTDYAGYANDGDYVHLLNLLKDLPLEIFEVEGEE